LTYLLRRGGRGKVSHACPRRPPSDRTVDRSTRDRTRYASGVQTRYLILAALAVGLIILAATAVWFSTL